MGRVHTAGRAGVKTAAVVSGGITSTAATGAMAGTDIIITTITTIIITEVTAIGAEVGGASTAVGMVTA
jgi:hypothetical protein